MTRNRNPLFETKAFQLEI